jgi:hypothetical protein
VLISSSFVVEEGGGGGVKRKCDANKMKTIWNTFGIEKQNDEAYTNTHTKTMERHLLFLK